MRARGSVTAPALRLGGMLSVAHTRMGRPGSVVAPVGWGCRGGLGVVAGGPDGHRGRADAVGKIWRFKARFAEFAGDGQETRPAVLAHGPIRAWDLDVLQQSGQVRVARRREGLAEQAGAADLSVQAAGVGDSEAVGVGLDAHLSAVGEMILPKSCMT